MAVPKLSTLVVGASHPFPVRDTLVGKIKKAYQSISAITEPLQ